MPLISLLIWLFALNAMCIIPFTYGPLTFACLLVSVWVMWRVQNQPAATTNPHRRTEATLVAITTVAAILGLASTAAGFLLRPDPMIDIGINTVAALDAFANGLNPYTSQAQLWVREFPVDTPHLVSENGQITMFGMPYFHGYPYFPLMMLSYLPAWLLTENAAAIRLTHVLVVILNLVAFRLFVSQHISSKGQQRLVLLAAATGWLGILRAIPEAMILGVTDILISAWLLFSFVALGRQQYFIAGILLGCAQACKLLPAPLVFLAMAWFLWGRKDLWNMTAGYALSCAVLVLPFVAWHPEGFISSTILYYLTHHSDGDMTSLWYFLPSSARSVFVMTGMILAVASIRVFNLPGQKNLVGCLAGAYASYVIFMAFSKMTHLNYLWGVLPLGSLALALMALSRAQSRSA